MSTVPKKKKKTGAQKANEKKQTLSTRNTEGAKRKKSLAETNPGRGGGYKRKPTTKTKPKTGSDPGKGGGYNRKPPAKTKPKKPTVAQLAAYKKRKAEQGARDAAAKKAKKR
tara:strand:+ start:324 stop:659 length:336 start_codon:yes stop_codon:yes gene_type:complete